MSCQKDSSSFLEKGKTSLHEKSVFAAAFFWQRSKVMVAILFQHEQRQGEPARGLATSASDEVRCSTLSPSSWFGKLWQS